MRILKITEYSIEFDNGKDISFVHDQDCCEINYADAEVTMKEYHVTGNQRIKGTFELHVYCDDSRGWFLWDKFDDLEDCYAEKFAVPNLHDCKVFELKEDGSKELVYLYID